MMQVLLWINSRENELFQPPATEARYFILSYNLLHFFFFFFFNIDSHKLNIIKISLQGEEESRAHYSVQCFFNFTAELPGTYLKREDYK